MEKVGPLTLALDFRELVEGLPVPVYTCDTEGRITFYNDAAVALWGRIPEIGKDYWYASRSAYRTDGTPLPPDECPMAIALKEERAVTDKEIIIELQDGIRLNVLPQVKPLFDNSGRISGIVNLLLDITEKRTQEEELQKSETQYRLLSEWLEKKIKSKNITLKKTEDRYHRMIEEVQDYAILLLDKDGNILNWNKGAEKIKGYSETEIIGKNFRIFYEDSDRKSKLPEQLITEASLKGRAMHEGWRVRKDGGKFWGSIVITALHSEKDEVIGFTKVTRDLTERKIAEDYIREKAYELELRNRELEQFAYIASHDLQEPLRKIQVFSGLMEKNLDKKEAVVRFLDKINSAARRMSNLIKDVLEYSKLSMGDELMVPVDLNESLENVLEDFELLLAEKKIVVQHSALPIIKGNRIQIHQLFTNLLSNAIKFSSQNPLIEVTSEVVADGELKKYPELKPTRQFIRLTFKDNGVGFDPQYTDDAFKLFKRLQDTEAGTGIGLAVCKKIVENHGGHISVTSQLNKGTSFFILLPVS